jgi:hypothetical protein
MYRRSRTTADERAGVGAKTKGAPENALSFWREECGRVMVQEPKGRIKASQKQQAIT